MNKGAIGALNIYDDLTRQLAVFEGKNQRSA